MTVALVFTFLNKHGAQGARAAFFLFLFGSFVFFAAGWIMWIFPL